jgi:hypothetical protein
MYKCPPGEAPFPPVEDRAHTSGSTATGSSVSKNASRE